MKIKKLLAVAGIVAPYAALVVATAECVKTKTEVRLLNKFANNLNRMYDEILSAIKDIDEQANKEG